MKKLLSLTAISLLLLIGCSKTDTTPPVTPDSEDTSNEETLPADETTDEEETSENSQVDPFDQDKTDETPSEETSQTDTRTEQGESTDSEVRDQYETDAPVETETPKPIKNAVYEGPSFIKLSSPTNEADITEEPIVFKGTVSPNTTKIVVTWKGNLSFEDGKYIDLDGAGNEDIYRLQNFKYGDSTFKYTAKVSYNNLGNGTNEYTFTAYFDDGKTQSKKVIIFYTDPSFAEMGKPVIYLYPEKETQVSVNVKPKNGISISIPEINDGWNVKASPDGTILNLADNKVYPYLFWEGFAANFQTPKEGFVVAKENVSKFFDNKLSYLGLNKKEIADFKEFWIPKFNEKPYYFITFIPQQEFDTYAPLTVSPSPETIIRVFFDYKGLDKKTTVPAQKLNKGERKGFTLIEWGGRLY